MVSEAVSLGADGVYTPSTGVCMLGLCTDAPAAFLLTNTSSAGVNITQVIIDLSSAVSSTAVFGGAAGMLPNVPFTPGPGAAATGFTADVGAKAITLNFTSFDPGVGFLFTVDIDDSNRTVSAAEFAGATLKVTFGDSGAGAASFATILNGTLAEAKVDGQATKVPEPASIILVGTGLLGFALVGRKRRGAQAPRSA